MWPRWLPLTMFVDSGDAASVGREVYGFPKHVGRLRVPSSAPCNGSFVVEIQVPTQRPAPPTWREVLHIRPLDSRKAEELPRWASLEEARDSLIELVIKSSNGPIGSVFPTLRDFRDSLIPGLVQMVFLKQFLEATSAGTACYQAIVEGGAGVLSFRGGGFTERPYEINVQSCDTQPFERVLGLSPGWQEVGHGIWLDFDFAMLDGETIWRAG